LRAVLSEIPAAEAALAGGHPSSSILSTSRRLLFGQVRALAWSFIRCPPWSGWFRQPPASKEARMNNVVRNYT
jgi:hypothetical protein